MMIFAASQHPRWRDGRFTVSTHAEAHVDLDPQVEDEVDDNPRAMQAWHRPGAGSPEFDRLCRRLLDVEDASAKVTVAMAGGTDDMFGTGSTLEDWTEITVTCAGRSKSFVDMPALLGALEIVAAGPLTRQQVGPKIGDSVTARFPNGVTWPCRVGNCSDWTILLIGTEQPPSLEHRRWFDKDDSEWWMWAPMDQVVALEPEAPETDG